MNAPDHRDLEIAALRERLSRLSEAGLRITQDLDFNSVLQGVLDSARSLTNARYGVIALHDDAGNAGDFLSSGLDLILPGAVGREVEFAYATGYDGHGRVFVNHLVREPGCSPLLEQPETAQG